MQLRALTGPTGADLTVDMAVVAASKCTLPTRFETVWVKTDAADGSPATVRRFTHVAARNGVADLALGTVPRGSRIDATVLVENRKPTRTFVVRGSTKTLLRPDLVVESVSAPEQVFVGIPFAVSVVVAERNLDVGATASVTLPAAGETRPVTVAAGGRATVEFPAVTLSNRAQGFDLAAAIRHASPAETDATNNTLAARMDVLLPPDLAVESVSAPEQVLVGRPFAVSVVIAERNQDVGATANVTLPAAGETQPVTIAAGGKATVEFPAVTLSERARGFDLAAAIRNASPAETEVANNTLAARMDVLFPPDLVIQAIKPQQTLVAQPFAVSVVITERNGDVGAAATVTLSAIPGASQRVEVGAGGTTTVDFAGVRFDAAVPTGVSADVIDATPAETDTTNNAIAGTIDVTQNQLSTPRTVLFPSFGGYGAQFNHHLYSPITASSITKGQYADLETKVKLLEPQLVRIFYNDNWEENADGTHPYPEYEQNYESFVRVVQLAQAAGATIDIAYQNLGNLTGAKPKRTPEEAMSRFADALQDLVRSNGLTNVRWAEVANEPNGPGGAVTLDLYNRVARALNDQLVARGLRNQIHLMGGGLVESSGDKHHYTWMRWIATNMSDVFDAYAQHIYWWYDEPGRFEYRLRDIAHLMTTDALIPKADQKPSYMMEFGIRGYPTCPGAPTVAANLYYQDANANCTEIWRTNIAAFQQLWFAIESAQLGFAGAAKWDAYWAVYDRTSQNIQMHWLLGPASENYPLLPAYHAMQLLFHMAVPGWQILQVQPWADDDWLVPGTPAPAWGGTGLQTASDQPEQELVAFAGPSGQLTILGLDTHGRDLNGVAPDPPSHYSIGGLPPNTTFTLAVWNATGDGTNSIAGNVPTNSVGVARFAVPLQAAFALTTVPVR
jgi:hypothetical protein